MMLCASSARISSNKEDLVVQFDNNEERFPLVWLRDNCTCNSCFHSASQTRTINWINFNTNVKAKSIEKNDGGVVIQWEDCHKSNFSFDWLKQRSFVKTSREKFLDNFYKPPKIVWDESKFSEIAKKYEYKEVMNDDIKFYNWLNDLACYGVVFMKNVPTDPNECHRFAKKLSIRKTHYGEILHIKANASITNVGYLPSLLQLHTDFPYYEHKPGVTILHCIEQTENQGGENLLVDVFYIAEKLRRENKEVFDILSSVDVNWLDVVHDDGPGYHYMFRSPIICLNSEGNVESVRYSINQRDSHFTVDIKYVKQWYNALKVFVDLINAHSCKFKTNPGEILAFDNTRLVHGRLSYRDTSQNQRYIIGFYVDWDEIYSKIRVLKGRYIQ